MRASIVVRGTTSWSVFYHIPRLFITRFFLLPCDQWSSPPPKTTAPSDLSASDLRSSLEEIDADIDAGLPSLEHIAYDYHNHATIVTFKDRLRPDVFRTVFLPSVADPKTLLPQLVAQKINAVVVPDGWLTTSKADFFHTLINDIPISTHITFGVRAKALACPNKAEIDGLLATLQPLDEDTIRERRFNFVVGRQSPYQPCDKVAQYLAANGLTLLAHDDSGVGSVLMAKSVSGEYRTTEEHKLPMLIRDAKKVVGLEEDEAMAKEGRDVFVYLYDVGAKRYDAQHDNKDKYQTQLVSQPSTEYTYRGEKM